MMERARLKSASASLLIMGGGVSGGRGALPSSANGFGMLSRKDAIRTVVDKMASSMVMGVFLPRVLVLAGKQIILGYLDASIQKNSTQ